MADGGRGAFPRTGRGGTLAPLKGGGVKPGGYYMLAVPGTDLVGLAGYRALKREGAPVDLDTLAVHYGTKSLQVELVRNGADIVADGVLGKKSDAAIKAYQQSHDLKPDGIAGPSTCRSLFGNLVRSIYNSHEASVDVGVGLVNIESGWDPGAVGRADDNDLGLCQINGVAHPNLDAAFRFDAEQAVAWQADFVARLRSVFGNDRDAVAAYNLGEWGAKRWIAAGRPDPFTPEGSTSPRSVVRYIDSVLGA